VAGDPYADPATGVLRNKLGLITAGELEAAEREITHAALISLAETPVRASYNLRHLCAIHRRIFGDIYEWAGQPFREGNGRAQRAFFSQLASDAGFVLDWQHLDADRNIAASSAIMRGDPAPMRDMLDELIREP
jgi:fido (protein-threonine AMPylation protein)